MKVEKPFELRFRESTQDGVHIVFTCDQFPVQAEGEVDGERFYFRARWGEMAFNVASNPADDPVSVECGMAEGYRDELGYDDTEYLSLDDAEAFIRAAAVKYRAWKQRATPAASAPAAGRGE